MDTVTGYPFNRVIVKSCYFIYGLYKYLDIQGNAQRFFSSKHTFVERKVIINKGALNDYLREKHNDGETPLRDLVEKHYGIKAVNFLERYF